MDKQLCRTGCAGSLIKSKAGVVAVVFRPGVRNNQSQIEGADFMRSPI